MKAAFLYGKEDIRLEEAELAPLEPAGMRIRMLRCGICGSDARMYFNGPTPRYINPVILGHELCGEIAEVGSAVKDYQVSDLVTVAPVIPCMHCPPCSRGEDNLCKKAGVVGCTIDGGMAEYLTVPSQMVRAGGVVRVPKGVGERDAALAELVGCCLHGLGKVGLRSGDRVAIIGDGPIGLTFLQVTRLMGAGYVATSGHRPKRRELAAELGADEALDGKVTNLQDHFPDRSLDQVIVAASSIEATKDALQIVRPGGSVLLFAGYLPGSSIDLPLNHIHYGELSIHGSIDCTIQDFRHAVRLLPKLSMRKLVTATFSLDEVVAGFQATKDRDAVKTMLEL